MTPAEIIKQMLSYLNMSAKQFATICGYDRPQAFYDIMSGKTKYLSPRMVRNILDAFPIFSRTWLFTGEGEMLSNSGHHAIVNGDGSIANTGTINCESFLTEIEKQRELTERALTLLEEKEKQMTQLLNLLQTKQKE